MAMTAQQKLLHVAKKLGLRSLKDMQATTRVVYDSNTTSANNHTLFEGASQRSFPATNLGAGGNKFQVNEALLVEKIGFFAPDSNGYSFSATPNMGVKFDLIIGNKTVLKDVVIEPGNEQAFYNDDAAVSQVLTLEGAGIVIPPQVEFKVVAKTFSVTDRDADDQRLGMYLYGTGVLLNFNTTI